jgi:myo-inositol 2-dehydrogenase/D-chiro-inositol 1-dehydrogenase
MIRLALLGGGRIGKVHAAAIAADPDAELAWVYDPIEPAAEALAKPYGTAASTDPDAVLADPTVDGVVIASPTPTHVDLLTQAVLAGKAVLCEKPIDLDLAKVDACWDAIAGRNPVVMVGFNRRFDPSFAEIHARVRAGEIGRLEQLVITSRDPAPAPADYLAVSGGLFRDMTIHDFDMARFFLGDVVEVQAMGANLVADYIGELGDIDTAMVVLRGVDGALCQITNSRRCAFGYDQRLEAFGARGQLAAHNQLATSVRFHGADRAESTSPYLTFFLERYADAYRRELAHFVAAVESGQSPSPGFADGRAALVLADAASESLRTGHAVRLTP